jgi:hypothetical protein
MLLREYYVPDALTLIYHQSLTDKEIKLSSDPLLRDFFRLTLALHFLERTKREPDELSFSTPYAEEFKSVANRLEDLYDSLTGISITLRFETTKNRVQQQFSEPRSGLESLLFSGGLDSFCEAVNHPSKFVLVHGVLNDTVYGRSRRLRMSCPTLAGSSMVTCRCVHKGLGGGISHTRGLLFLVLAGWVCSTMGSDHVVFAENGPLMLNPETTPTSPPTRNCDPRVVMELQSILHELKGQRFAIMCPNKDRTKTEVAASTPKRFYRWFPSTSSCFSTRTEKMCGICFGCFVRRLSLGALGCDEMNDYAFDVFSDDLYRLGEQKITRIIDLRHSLRFFGKLVNDSLGMPENEPAQFFEDPTSMMKRFGLDLVLGIRNLFELHPSYESQNAFGRYCAGFLNEMSRELIDRRRSDLDEILSVQGQSSQSAT